MERVTVEKIPKKKKFSVQVLKYLIPLLFMYLLAVNFTPVKPISEKDFFKNDRPLVIAHQGGELLAPSNTILCAIPLLLVADPSIP